VEIVLLVAVVPVTVALILVKIGSAKVPRYGSILSANGLSIKISKFAR